MAKYEVTHTCGHTHTYQLYGKTADRERKMAWLAEQECPECAKRAREEQHKAEAEAAAKEAEDMELPALTGSPKQIAWANTIRGKFIALLQETKGVKMDNALIVIRLYTSSSWWIDHRDLSIPEGMLINMIREHKDEVLAIINGTAKQEQPATKTKDEEATKQPAEATAAHAAEETPANAEKDTQKSVWRKIAVNLQNIAYSTGRAELIKMPHSSKFDGYSVWVSNKLLREGRHSYEYLMSVKSDMEFQLKKYSKSWSHDKVNGVPTKTITAEELAEAFGGWVEDAPRYSRPAATTSEDEVVIEKHEPAPLAPVAIEADPELTR